MAKESLPNIPFEEQFRRKHTIEISSKKIEYSHFSPEKTTSNVPIVLLPGLTENPVLLKKLIKKLYDDGRSVYTLAYPRDAIPVDESEHPPAQEQKIVVTSALIKEARKVNSVNKVDLVARSDGGINATFAAARNPEAIDNLILVDTKYTNRENPFLLSFRLLDHAKQEAKDVIEKPFAQGYLVHGVTRGIMYVAPHPSHTWQEIRAIAATDIKPTLVEIREKGVAIYGVHGTSDALLPFDQAQKAISVFTKDSPKLFDGFYSTGAHQKSPSIDHASIYKYDKYIDVISYAVKAARARSEKIR